MHVRLGYIYPATGDSTTGLHHGKRLQAYVNDPNK